MLKVNQAKCKLGCIRWSMARQTRSENAPSLSTCVATSGLVCLSLGVFVLEKWGRAGEGPEEIFQGFGASVERLRELGFISPVN